MKGLEQLFSSPPTEGAWFDAPSLPERLPRATSGHMEEAGTSELGSCRLYGCGLRKPITSKKK